MSRDPKGRFRKGSKRPPNAGRRKGTPNAASREWKECALSLANDPELQARLRAHVLKHPELLFKIAEHAFGRPRQALEVNQAEFQMIQWPDCRCHGDISEE